MTHKEFQEIMKKEIKNLNQMIIKHEQNYNLSIRLILAKELYKLCQKDRQLNFVKILKAYANFKPDQNLDKQIANTIKKYFLNQINEPAQ